MYIWIVNMGMFIIVTISSSGIIIPLQIVCCLELPFFYLKEAAF